MDNTYNAKHFTYELNDYIKYDSKELNKKIEDLEKQKEALIESGYTPEKTSRFNIFKSNEINKLEVIDKNIAKNKEQLDKYLRITNKVDKITTLGEGYKLPNNLKDKIEFLGSYIPEIQPVFNTDLKNAIRNINNRSFSEIRKESVALEELLNSALINKVGKPSNVQINDHQYTNMLASEANSRTSKNIDHYSFEYNKTFKSSEMKVFEEFDKKYEHIKNRFDPSNKELLSVVTKYADFKKNKIDSIRFQDAFDMIDQVMDDLKNESINEFAPVIEKLNSYKLNLNKQLEEINHSISNFDFAYLNENVNKEFEKEQEEINTKNKMMQFQQEYRHYLDVKNSLDFDAIEREEKVIENLKATLGLTELQIQEAIHNAEYERNFDLGEQKLFETKNNDMNYFDARIQGEMNNMNELRNMAIKELQEKGINDITEDMIQMQMKETYNKAVMFNQGYVPKEDTHENAKEAYLNEEINNMIYRGDIPQKNIIVVDQLKKKYLDYYNNLSDKNWDIGFERFYAEQVQQMIEDGYDLEEVSRGR